MRGPAAAAIAPTGCAGIKPIEPKAEQLQAILSIAAASAPEPEAFEVRNLKHPAFAFGALGGAIAAADWSDKQARLTRVLQPLSPAPTGWLAQEVVGHLKCMGYDARPVQAQWTKRGKDGKPDIDPAAAAAAAGGVDALLMLEPLASRVASRRPGTTTCPPCTRGGAPLLQPGTPWAGRPSSSHRPVIEAGSQSAGRAGRAGPAALKRAPGAAASVFPPPMASWGPQGPQPQRPRTPGRDSGPRWKTQRDARPAQRR